MDDHHITARRRAEELLARTAQIEPRDPEIAARADAYMRESLSRDQESAERVGRILHQRAAPAPTRQPQPAPASYSKREVDDLLQNYEEAIGRALGMVRREMSERLERIEAEHREGQGALLARIARLEAQLDDRLVLPIAGEEARRARAH